MPIKCATMSAGKSLIGALLITTALCAAPAHAKIDPAVARQLWLLRLEVNAQHAKLEQQQKIVEIQQKQIDDLKRLASDGQLATFRGAGPAGPQPDTLSSSAPEKPVGEAPVESEPIRQAQVAALPDSQGVLTPAHHLILDPQIEYLNASNNRLVFRGFEIIPGIQIGAIEASSVESNTVVATAAARYGLTNRIEAEIRVPYLYRHDHLQIVQQRDQSIVRTVTNSENNIGDVEFAIRYQLNNPHGQQPIWVAELRGKTPTGKGPFSVGYDSFGVATGLATGSGFWGVQPGISFLLPSDPVVIYGGASYFWHIAGNVNKDIGETHVGHVNPGDAINANVGFGFALNPRFSFSLGYKHSFIFPTTTEIGDTVQHSDHLQVGSLTFGMAYRITERRTINLGFGFGVTKDSPGLDMSLRFPLQF